MKNNGLSIPVPTWLRAEVASMRTRKEPLEARMAWVIALALRNTREKQESQESGSSGGGPFAAAVFDRHGHVLAAGVNLVVACRCSILHAEIVALALAQQDVGRFDLSAGGLEWYELLSSSEPCAMCFGALPWSGISQLVCAARASDATALGFDEGSKPAAWMAALRRRGIEVVRDVFRDRARAVLASYAANGGTIYNAG